MAGDLGCPSCKAGADQLIGHKVRGFYDGVAFWVCTSCAHAWPRDFGENSWRNKMAAEYAQTYQQDLVYEDISTS